MRFTEGNNYSKGRPKNAQNKNHAKVKEAFAMLLDHNLDGMEKDLKTLSPKERLHFLLDISQYIIPKLKHQENEFIEQPLFPDILYNLIDVDENKFNDL